MKNASGYGKINGGELSVLLTVAWRNVWRNRRRTVLCVSAVGIAVFFNIFMQSWIAGMTCGIEDIVRTFDTGDVFAVSRQFEADREYLPVQYPLKASDGGNALAARVESLPGVRAAFPRILTYASLFDSVVKHAALWGIDIDRERMINHFNLTKKSDGLVAGRFPRAGKNECAIGITMSRKTGLGIGDSIPLKTVSSQFSDKYWSPLITGLFDFDYQRFDEETILVPFDRLQRILGLGDGVQQLVVYVDRPRDAPRVRKSLSAILEPGTVVREWTDNYWVVLLGSMSGMYLIIFAVFQIVASFLIVNTMLMIIHERIKEIGMMGALGMSRREIVGVFFLEAVLLSVIGSLAGCVVGGVSSLIGSLYPLDMNTFTGGGMKDFPISGTMYLDFSFVSIVEGFVFGVVVSAVCTIIPSMKSAFVEPVDALRR